MSIQFVVILQKGWELTNTATGDSDLTIAIGTRRSEYQEYMNSK